MTMQQLNEKQPPLFSSETIEEAFEYFRLTVPLLTKNNLPPNPVNFGLVYNYVAGRDTRLKEKLDEIFAEKKELTQEEAKTLFLRFIYSCDQTVLEELREELLGIVAEMMGTLVDLAGKASVSSNNLKNHIDKLASSKNTRDILSVVSSIMSETRSLAMGSKELEEQLTSSSAEMMKLKDELERARHEAFIDALTGVLNRRGFDQALTALMKESEHKIPDFSLLMVDIDHFKVVNDKYGHLIGDKVLQAIAKLLIKHTKGGDKVARYGGEEFAILLPETYITNAFTVAEYIRMHIEKLVLKRPRTGERLSDITASFGVAGYRSGESAEEFINRCDKALYKAKELGRNRVVLAD